MKGLLCVASFLLLTAQQPSSPSQPQSPSDEAFLPAEPAVPFPIIAAADSELPSPKRTRFIDSDAAAGGNGTSARPWNDLQTALCKLEPGDRLLVAPRHYKGPFFVDRSCRDGTFEAPIQVFAQDAFLEPTGDSAVFTIERAHWQFWHLQIALNESKADGFVAKGLGAHDIDVNHSHISDGDGVAIRIREARRVSITDSHIHHSGGIRLEAGADAVTLRNNHVHHNRAAALQIDGAQDVNVAGNRMHNNASSIEVAAANVVTIFANKLWNFAGPAIALGAAARRIELHCNAVVEATLGIVVDGAEDIVIGRNHFENRLRAGESVLDVRSGKRIRATLESPGGCTGSL